MKLTTVLLVALCVLALVYQTSAKKRAGKRYRRDTHGENEPGDDIIIDDDMEGEPECDCPCQKPSRPAGFMCFEIGDTKFFGGAGKPYQKPRKPCKSKDKDDGLEMEDDPKADDNPIIR